MFIFNERGRGGRGGGEEPDLTFFILLGLPHNFVHVVEQGRPGSPERAQADAQGGADNKFMRYFKEGKNPTTDNASTQHQRA